jgi:hypothetical protein
MRIEHEAEREAKKKEEKKEGYLEAEKGGKGVNINDVMIKSAMA